MPAAKRKTTTKRGNNGSRKKSTRGRRASKAPAVEHDLPGGFWRQVVAVLMIALALVLVITWFGHGGEFLNEVHKTFLSFLGFGTYVIPALFVYLGVKILRSENNRVAIPVYIASFLMLFWVSGVAAIWNNGGEVGKWLNNIMLQALDQGFVIVIYIVLILITAAFILQLSPMALLHAGREKAEEPEKKAKTLEVEPALKKRKPGQLDIVVNSGLNEADEEEPKGLKKASRFLHKNNLKITQPAMEEEVTPVAPPVQKEKALVAADDTDWKLPNISLLEKKQSPADPGNVQQNAFIIQSTLHDFGIEVEMEGANVGPRVTQYTLKPPAGVNLSKILARDKELSLNLAVPKVRIEAPIPGTSLVGIEIPNTKAADVRLRGVLESPEWKKATAPLTFAIGKDISGRTVIADLAEMPHLLIAGTTGSGKSVMTNAMIVSLLYRNSPADLKLIIIDPKQVEMTQYSDIPHLLTPIITDTAKAVSALKWAVDEMERRYTLLSESGVKKIQDYNKKVESGEIKSKDENGNEVPGKKMPYIVILVDEMSDIMMQAGKELEPPIVRIAQKGRAAGLHLILATQKPIVKVVTGLIKGNVPGRIAFAVSSVNDSMVMIDKGGAEKLLGSGDMLMLTTKMQGIPRRIQGCWVSDGEEEKVAAFLKSQRGPEYNEEVIAQAVSSGIGGFGGGAGGGGLGDGLGRRFDPNDPVVRKAVEISLQKGKFSTAMLQTYLGKGHGFVSGLAIWFEEIGVIGPQNGNKPRDVLITSMEEFDQVANA